MAEPSDRKRHSLKPVWLLLIGLFTLVGFGLLWVKQKRSTSLVISPTDFPSAGDGIAWKNQEADAIALGHKLNKPVVIDFTAEWCIPCQEMNDTVFHDPRVVEKMKSVIPLRLDMSEETEAQENTLRKYQIDGLPTILFIDAKGQLLENPRVLGMISADEFLKLLNAL